RQHWSLKPLKRRLAPASGAGRRAGPRFHAREPVGELAEGGIQRLAYLGPEIHETVEQDVGQGEAVAGDPRPLELALQPLQAVAGDGLQPWRGLRQDAHAVLEQRQAL